MSTNKPDRARNERIVVSLPNFTSKSFAEGHAASDTTGHCIEFAVFGNCSDKLNCKSIHKHTIGTLIFIEKDYQLGKKYCDAIIICINRQIDEINSQTKNCNSIIAAQKIHLWNLQLSELYRFYAHITHKLHGKQHDVINYFNRSLLYNDTNVLTLNDYAIYIDSKIKQKNKNEYNQNRVLIESNFEKAISIISNCQSNNIYNCHEIYRDKIAIILHVNYGQYLAKRMQRYSLSLNYFDKALSIVSKYIECNKHTNNLNFILDDSNLLYVAYYCCILFSIARICFLIHDYCESIEWYKILVDFLSHLNYNAYSHGKPVMMNINCDNSSQTYFSNLVDDLTLKQLQKLSKANVDLIRKLIKTEAASNVDGGTKTKLNTEKFKEEKKENEKEKEKEKGNVVIGGWYQEKLEKGKLEIYRISNKVDEKHLKRAGCIDIAKSRKIEPTTQKDITETKKLKAQQKKKRHSQHGPKYAVVNIKDMVHDSKTKINENIIQLPSMKFDVNTAHINNNLDRIASTSDGCSFICDELSRMSSAQLQQFYCQILPFAFDWCTHNFANKIICHFVTIADNQLIIQFVEKIIVPNIEYFSLNKYGSLVIQSCLHRTKCDVNSVTLVLNKINDIFYKCISHPYGSFVVSKCFDEFDASVLKNLALNFHGNVREFSLRPYSCNVVQKSMEKLALDERMIVMNEILDSLVELSKDPNGHCVVDQCLQRSPAFLRWKMVNQVFENALDLGKHKYGLVVFELCCDYATDEQMEMFIQWLFENRIEDNNNKDARISPYSSNLMPIVFDPVGIDVVKALFVTSGKKRKLQLIEHLRSIKSNLQREALTKQRLLMINSLLDSSKSLNLTEDN